MSFHTIASWAAGRRAAARTRMTVTALVTALVLSACGGATDGDGAEPTEGDGADETAVEMQAEGAAETTGAGADTTETTETTEAGSGEDEPETLADYLGFDLDDPDAAAARAMEEQRQVEESIARCMAEEGFEYVPAVRPVSSSEFALDEEEFARERGFGITTGYGEEQGLTEDLREEDDGWVDPNAAIVEALSESERAAYRETLYGTDFETGSDGDAEGFELEPDFGGGCSGAAFEKVYGAQAEVWNQLGPKFEELNQRLFADPRFQEASDEWAACMNERGYPYNSVEQLYEEVFADFSARLAEIVGEAGSADPFEGWTQEEVEEFLTEKSDQEINDFYEQAHQKSLENIDRDALAALQQEEREVAMAAFECQQTLEGVVDDLMEEYEARFIRENRDILEQLRP